MPPRPEILTVAGREVTVTNPDKVFFPDAAGGPVTKLELVRYYVAVADGALRGAGGRPMALKRYPNGAGGDFFFQKRAPENRPDVAPHGGARLPVGPDRRRDRGRRTRPASPGWPTSAASTSTRTRSAPTTSTIPTSCGSTSTPSRASPGTTSGGSPSSSAKPSPTPASSAGRRPPAAAASTSTSGSSAAGPFPEVRRAALALARDVERRAPALATSRWWKEERHGVFIDYNQNAKDRTVASAYSVRPRPDARVSMPLWLGRGRGSGRGGLHPAHGPGAVRPRRRRARGYRRRRRQPRRPPGALGTPRDRGPGRRAVAAELREDGRRAAPGRTLEAADEHEAAHRDRARREAGRRDRRPRALEGAPSRRPGRTSARRTSSWTRCAAAPPPGPGSASTWRTSRPSCARRRSRSTRTTTRGPAWTGRGSRPGRRRRRGTLRRPRAQMVSTVHGFTSRTPR